MSILYSRTTFRSPGWVSSLTSNINQGRYVISMCRYLSGRLCVITGLIAGWFFHHCVAWKASEPIWSFWMCPQKIEAWFSPWWRDSLHQLSLKPLWIKKTQGECLGSFLFWSRAYGLLLTWALFFIFFIGFRIESFQASVYLTGGLTTAVVSCPFFDAFVPGFIGTSGGGDDKNNQ